MKAVVYGAGNIGRGFIGQLFFESGYDVTFIDVNSELVEEINAKKKYPIKFVGENTSNLIKSEIWIENVSAVDGNNKSEVIKAIEQADIMAVSVGVNALKYIFEPLALGINKRFKNENFNPLNIIICENLMDAEKVMRDGVYAYIDENFKKLYGHKVGFVEASVGRTVPVQTEQMKGDNSLQIAAESYGYLPVDKKGFCGDAPEIKNMIMYSPFEYYIERKLYIHNMGHAFCAYLGDIFGYEYIWEAVRNPFIKLMAMRAMQRSAFALAKKYKADAYGINSHIENLLYRFSNKTLGDTVARVGNDLKRKLSPNDRLVGTLELCRQQGVSVCYINLAIAAALNFKTDKLSGQSANDIITQAGSKESLGADFKMIEKFDKAIKSTKTPKKLLEIIESEENSINEGI